MAPRLVVAFPAKVRTGEEGVAVWARCDGIGIVALVADTAPVLQHVAMARHGRVIAACLRKVEKAGRFVSAIKQGAAAMRHANAPSCDFATGTLIPA